MTVTERWRLAKLNTELRFLLCVAALAAAFPVLVFAMYFAGWTLHPLLQGCVFVLCPAYILFVGTAACSPFSLCSLATLAAVMVVNALMYVLVAKYLWPRKKLGDV